MRKFEYKPGDLIISETGTGMWNYHLRIVGPEGLKVTGGAGPALCGRKLGWDVMIPLETYGRKSEHISEKYCIQCAEEARRRGFYVPETDREKELLKRADDWGPNGKYGNDPEFMVLVKQARAGTKVRPLSKVQWPEGIHAEWVLFLKALPEELTNRFGLIFHDGCDDLDYTKTAGALIGTSQALFVCHLRSPSPGTSLLMESGPPESRVSEEFVDELLKKMALTRADIEACRTEKGCK